MALSDYQTFYTGLLSSQETHLIIKGMMESKFLSLTPRNYRVLHLILSQPHLSLATELCLHCVCDMVQPYSKGDEYDAHMDII